MRAASILHWIAGIVLYTLLATFTISTYPEAIKDPESVLKAFDGSPFATVVAGVHRSGLAVALASACAVLLADAFAVAVHEFAHAAMARRLGAQVHAVVIGEGPRVAALHVHETRVLLGLLPVRGLTRLDGSLTGEQHRRVLLAGPRSHLLLVLAFAAAVVFIPPAIAGLAIVLALRQAETWAMNMAATRPRPGRLPSDGWQLAQLKTATTPAHDR